MLRRKGELINIKLEYSGDWTLELRVRTNRKINPLDIRERRVIRAFEKLLRGD